MGIKLVTFAAQTVTPQDDALIYETALQESGMIYGGVVTIKNANVLHVDAGHGALCGRKFTIEATDVPVPLTASGSLQGRIYIHMDLSDTGDPISFQVETATSLTPVIQQADVNINSGIYEINLATFIVDTSTISNLVNVAPFIDIEPDSGFNAQSNNPVQNKVITKAVGVPETIGNLASQEYNIGDTLVATDGQFYDVIAHISPNATIVLNGNVTLGGNIVDLINSLSSQISNFAYKFLGVTNGNATINLPSNFTELLIIVRANVQDTVNFTFNILKDYLDRLGTEKGFRNGYYIDASNHCFVYILATASSLHLQEARLGGSDVTSGSNVFVWYK